MGNHCIDVACVDCGRAWCVRGCSDRDGPNPELAERLQLEHVPAEVMERPHRYWDERCACGSHRVVSN